jgi:GntR family carbon starvation induced transcriptional regulator
MRESPSKMTEGSDSGQSTTLAIEVFESLRADILSSKLAPGTKLRFQDLRDAYGVGLSPLREALSRLAENRLVVAAGQRGFRVPIASAEDIRDVSMVRKEIESLALRLSIEHGDDAWEARVVASRHKLALLGRGDKTVTEDEWEKRHREFHLTLVSACQSPSLLHLYSLLTDQFDRYRRLSAKSRLPNSPRALVHQRLVDATLSRNADLAVKVLQDHIDEATDLIVAGLAGTKDVLLPKKARAAKPAKRKR